MDKIFSKGKIQISPSLICLDMMDILGQVRELEANGIRMLHVDILDGHFSPSMPLGFELVRQLREKTDLAFDCHVMVNSPEYFVNELLDIGVQQIVLHLETAEHADGLINHIHEKGVRAGVALKPATPVSCLECILEKCDTVLLMLINPGYASSSSEGQIPYAAKKIKMLNEMVLDMSPDTLIELDGRISPQSIEEFSGYGADIFVGGTRCINRDDIAGSMKLLQRGYRNENNIS